MVVSNPDGSMPEKGLVRTKRERRPQSTSPYISEPELRLRPNTAVPDYLVDIDKGYSPFQSFLDVIVSCI